MDIRTQFELVRNTGYSSPREYIDLRNKSHKSLTVKHKKRQSFFVDLQKQSAKIPGPGKYVVNPEDPKIAKKVYKKINFEELSKKPKQSYIQEAVKSKKNIPGVGKYEIVIDKSEQIRKKYEPLGNRLRKQAPLFKSTVFDCLPVDTLKVGPGTYDSIQPFGEKKSFRMEFESKPEEQDDKGKQNDKKKSMSLPKLPTPQTYHPIPVEYATFDKMKSMEQDRGTLRVSKQQRFKYKDDGIPGPNKYSLIAEWSPRNKDKPGKNIFKSLSQMPQPRVYN